MPPRRLSENAESSWEAKHPVTPAWPLSPSWLLSVPEAEGWGGRERDPLPCSLMAQVLEGLGQVSMAGVLPRPPHLLTAKAQNCLVFCCPGNTKWGVGPETLLWGFPYVGSSYAGLGLGCGGHVSSEFHSHHHSSLLMAATWSCMQLLTAWGTGDEGREWRTPASWAPPSFLGAGGSVLVPNGRGESFLHIRKVTGKRVPFVAPLATQGGDKGFSVSCVTAQGWEWAHTQPKQTSTSWSKQTAQWGQGVRGGLGCSWNVTYLDSQWDLVQTFSKVL